MARMEGVRIGSLDTFDDRYSDMHLGFVDFTKALFLSSGSITKIDHQYLVLVPFRPWSILIVASGFCWQVNLITEEIGAKKVEGQVRGDDVIMG